MSEIFKAVFRCRLTPNPRGYNETMLAGEIESGKKRCPLSGKVCEFETEYPPNTTSAAKDAARTFPQPCDLCGRTPTNMDFTVSWR